MIAVNNKRPAATTIAIEGGLPIKNEKRVPDPVGDGEYDEWARGLVNRPIPQLGPGLPGNQPGLLGGGTIVTSGFEGNLPPHQEFDIDSAIGRFTWHTVPNTDKSVPCVYRSGEAYCCVRMVEISIIGDLLHVLPQEVYDAAKLNSHFVTAAEAKLLSYISTWHCDGEFGQEPFTIEDLVISIPEMERFYHYLQFSYEVLSSGGGNKSEDYTRCGFVRVNNESLIPYTVLSETEKGVPLFYFEGQTDILKEKAAPLQGWELAYLKICCKVQGVRKDLISAESLLIVKLTDLRGYFPKRTVFTDKCWPPAKSKSLITKNMLMAKASYTPSAKTNAITNSNQNQTQARWPISSDNSNTNNLRAGNAGNNLTSTLNRLAGQLPQSGSANITNSATISVMNNQVRNLSTFNNYNGTGQPPQGYSNGYQVQQTQHQRNGPTASVNIQGPRNQIITSKSTAELYKLKVNTPPISMSGLNILPEFPDGQRDGAYQVRMIIIEGEVVYCINSKPHKHDAHLLVLQEFINKFFSSVTIYPTAVSVLKSIGLTTYLPNSSQVRALNSYGFSVNRPWEMPLIPAKEAAQMMPRIRIVLTPKPTPPRLNSIPDIANNTNRGLNGFYFPGQAR